MHRQLFLIDMIDCAKFTISTFIAPVFNNHNPAANIHVFLNEIFQQDYIIHTVDTLYLVHILK